jgi:hypothetical protein
MLMLPMLSLCALQVLAGRAAGSRLQPEDALALQEAVARYAVSHVGPPCSNHGSKAGYCLMLGKDQEDPPDRLLGRLADIQPPVLGFSDCRRRGVVGESRYTTDPTIWIHWVKRRGPAFQAKVTTYCWTSLLSVRRTKEGWSIEELGRFGCGPVPGDCAS